jgi:hypothetical protein
MEATTTNPDRNPQLASVPRRSGLRRGILMVGVLLALLGSSTPASPQRSSDENRIQRFVNDVGQLLFFFAWPTATYDGLSFDGIARRNNGVDAQLTLYGSSTFGGRLWTRLILEIRNGQISNMRWGENNAIIAQPGATMRHVAQAIADLNQRYQSTNSGAQPPSVRPPSVSPPAPIALKAVCIANSTQGPLVYTMAWNGTSETRRLEAGQAQLYWANAGTPDFLIAFDDEFAEGYTERTFRLPGVPLASTPADCANAIAFDFQVENGFVGLSPRRWIPGIEHPYYVHVVRSVTEGSWNCAPGFRWASADQNSLECVESWVGLVGISLVPDPSNRMPKIASISPGSPAERAGLTTDLWVTSVDGVSTIDRSITDITAMVRGSIGSQVRLEVADVFTRRTVVLERR